MIFSNSIFGNTVIDSPWKPRALCHCSKCSIWFIHNLWLKYKRTILANLWYLLQNSCSIKSLEELDRKSFQRLERVNYRYTYIYIYIIRLISTATYPQQLMYRKLLEMNLFLRYRPKCWPKFAWNILCTLKYPKRFIYSNKFY